MTKLKVMTVLGTRPEIIRLSRIIPALDKTTDHCLVHTGQNYDYGLNGIFFEELGVREPDHYLKIDTSSLGKSLADVILKTEAVILKEQPEAMLVLGDTNSAVASLIAKRMKVPTYHMEAGNRSFDANVPEEINRKLVDHISDFNLVYTEHARRHLLSEGLPHRFIYLTGSPMREVLEGCLPAINNSKVLRALNVENKKYFIISVHREENVDSRENLLKIVNAIKVLFQEYKIPIIVSTHPRTKDRLKKVGLLNNIDGVSFMPPFGFFDYNKLQMESFCAISDSGTISEESSILDFPAVTLRRSIERPEAIDTGAIALSSFDGETLIQNVNIATMPRFTFSDMPREIPAEYQIRNTSERVVRLISGTARLAGHWKNMDSFSRYDW